MSARKAAADRWLNFCKLNPGHSLCKTRKKPKAAKTKRGVSHSGWDKGGGHRRQIGSDTSPPPKIDYGAAKKPKGKKGKGSSGSWDDPIELG